MSMRFGIGVPVLKLYGNSSPVHSMMECPDGRSSSLLGTSHQDMIQKAGNLHKHMRQNQYTHVFPVPGGQFTDDVDGDFGQDGGELKGKGFKLQIPSQKERRENRQFVRVRTQDPKPYLKHLDDRGLQPLHESMVIPIFNVEIKARNQDAVVSDMSLVVPLDSNKELDGELVVLRQDKTSSVWNDITENCKMHTFSESTVITIPIDKSSKFWVLRVKRSLHSLLYVLLALLLGRILFRILVFFKVRNKDISLRIIGITEELYQSRKGLRTEVDIAKEGGFQIAEECDAKQLLRRGKLSVSFYLAGICQNSYQFNLGGSSTSKVAQRHDFKFSICDLKHIPKVQIKTADEAEEVLWSVDLMDLINIQECDEPSTSLTRPKFESYDEEVKDGDIPWLAHEVNKDWKKLAVCLGISYTDIQIIKDNDTKRDVEHRCSTMLRLWRKNVRHNRGKATWSALQQALQQPLVGRSDIVRHLLQEDEISDRILLKLAHEVGGSWKKLGCCLNIGSNEIDIIDANETAVEEKCMALLQKWRQGKDASRSELIKALQDPVMLRHDLATNLLSC